MCRGELRSPTIRGTRLQKELRELCGVDGRRELTEFLKEYIGNP